MKMNILVLGGNGYLGSKVVKELVKNSNTVVCTRRSTSNLSGLKDIENQIKWIPATTDGVESVLKYTHFDCLINLACNYGNNRYLYDGIIGANLEFPLNILDLMVAYGTKKILTIGTGLPDAFNMYSFTKNVFGKFGNFYAEKNGITFYNLLLEMFYGADEPENRFIPSIIIKMIKGEDVKTTIGCQHRDIIYVKDVVDAVIMILLSGLEGYNEIPVGTGVAPSISDVVDFIWENTGKKSKVQKGAIPIRIGEPDSIADTEIIKSIGNWDPIPWKKGIKYMIDTIKERFS